MKHNLCGNMKKFRKAKGLTQEQLAEAMGVTVGTISKWENGNCLPDISMIMELADFYEVSVDVLVGYDTPQKKVPEILERIEAHYRKHELTEALDVCNKALVKFPNRFELLMMAARICYIRWYESKTKDARIMAIDFYRKAKQNLPDDENKTRNEIFILHNLALLEEDDKKKIGSLAAININSIFDAEIGEVYRNRKDITKAYQYFSNGLYVRSLDVINVTGRWLQLLVDEQQYETALDMIAFSEMILKTIYHEKMSSIGMKMLSELEIIKAFVHELMGNHKEMKASVKKAYEAARIFDAAPVFELHAGANFWLCESEVEPVAFDEQGPSAVTSAEQLLLAFEREYEGKAQMAAKRVHDCWKMVL